MKPEDDPALSQLTAEEFARLQESFVEMGSTGSEPGSVDDPQSRAWYESLVVKLADALQGVVGDVAEEFTDGGHLPPDAAEMPAHVLTADEWIQQRFGKREVDDKERALALREHRVAISQAIHEGLFVAPEVIQSHPALWRQTQEQNTVDRQRQQAHEWEVVEDDGFEVVEDLDASATPFEVPSEIPEGRPSAAFVNVLNPGAMENVDIEKPVEIPTAKPAAGSEQAARSPQYENEPRIQPTAAASAPMSDDMLAAMFGAGGNPWAVPSDPVELPSHSGQLGTTRDSESVPTPSAPEVPTPTTPAAPEPIASLISVHDAKAMTWDELQIAADRIAEEMAPNGAWEHPDFKAVYEEIGTRHAESFRPSWARGEGFVGTVNPNAKPLPLTPVDEWVKTWKVPKAEDIAPPNEQPREPIPLGESAQQSVDELRAVFAATRKQAEGVVESVREPLGVTGQDVLDRIGFPPGRGRSVIETVLGNVFGFGGGGGRVPPTGGGPPDEPPDGPDDEGIWPSSIFEGSEPAEADWLGTFLSGHAGMSPETAARWAGRLRGAGARFLQGAGIGTATHGAAAGTAGGVASMGFGVEAGVPLGNLAMDGFSAIANAPQWLQRADQGDVGRGIVGAGASIGGAAIGMGVGAAVGGPVGAAVGGVLGEGFEQLVMWTEKLVEGLLSFAERINKSNEELGRYNGTIAATQMQLEMNRMSREFERASETAGSAATLAKAVDEMEESTKGFNEDLSNVSNTLATMAADFVGTLGKLYDFTSSLSPVSLETAVTAGVSAALGMIPGIGPALSAAVTSNAMLRRIEENTRGSQDVTPMGKAIIRELITQAPQKVKDPINPLWEK